MPFRNGYDGVYDPATLQVLQNVFERLWGDISAKGSATVSREELARRIISAYEQGLTPDHVRDYVLREATHPPLAAHPEGNE